MIEYKRNIGWILTGLLLLSLLVSCSDPNAQAPSENQIHASGWASTHGAFSVADPVGCTSCHGADYTGSGSAVSCYSCHYDGPPFSAHPSTWTMPFTDHRAYVTSNGFSSCSLSACHGANPFVQGGLTAPSCGTANYTNSNGSTFTCHSGHISGANWLLPAAHAADAISDINRCWTCHALNAPSPTPAATACRVCHVASDPLMVQGACASCHNNPPNGNAPAGNTRPNRSGEHNKHVNGEGFVCATCHQGFGTNTLGHWYPDPLTPADVNFAATIAVTYDGTRCNGSCHGKNHNSESW